MDGSLKRIVDEDDPVLALADVFTKEHSREDSTDEDDLFEAYLAAAIEQVEQDSRRPLLLQTWRLSLDRYPECGAIELQRCPVVEVVSFEVQDSDGDWQTVDPDEYTVDTESEPGRIVRTIGGVWPTVMARIGGVRITFTAGYADADSVPDRAKQAVRFLTGHWFRNRTPIAIGTITSELDLTYKNLLLGLKW